MVRMHGGSCNKSKPLSLAAVDVRVYLSYHAESCHVTNLGVVQEHQKTSLIKILIAETFVFYFHCSIVFTLSDSNRKFLILVPGEWYLHRCEYFYSWHCYSCVLTRQDLLLSAPVCIIWNNKFVVRQVILIVVTLIIPITLLRSG